MSFLRTSRREPHEPTLALMVAAVLIVVVFVVITGRLVQLQLLKGGTFRTIAEEIATEPQPLPFARGRIFDREGRLLADNVATSSLLVTPSEVHDSDAMLAWLNTEVLEEPRPGVLLDRWNKAVQYSRYKPSVLVPELTYDELAYFKSHAWDNHPGLEARQGPQRTYLYPHMFAHTIGYLGEVSEHDIERLNDDIVDSSRRYVHGDYIGKKGVELSNESRLRGARGREIVIRNRLGSQLKDPAQSQRVLQELSALENAYEDPTHGYDVHLTIDLGLQQAIAEAFGDQSGAVVAIDVRDGSIRAMYNNPTYDPAAFARGLTVAEWEVLRDHPDAPLNDKSLRGLYPPGSTYKVVTAAAALKYGEVTPEEKVFCPGYLKFGNRSYRCWSRGGHGYVDLNAAIQRSCDVYFYKMGLRVGVDRLAVVARDFGFGSPTGVGINDEKGGLVPTREWKRMNRFEEWQEGETLSVAIGQGFDLVTPMQLATAYAALANDGQRYRPRLVEKIVHGKTGEILNEFPDEHLGELKLSQETQELVRKGLWSVVNEPGGTAYWRARIPELGVAGKTGTSQVIRMEENISAAVQERYKDHALFAAYAPYDDPELAVAVIVEHGGHGSTAAAPIAKAALEYWFADRIAEAKKNAPKKTPAPSTPTPAPTPQETAEETPEQIVPEEIPE